MKAETSNSLRGAEAQPEKGEAVVGIRQLRKSFGEQQVLKNVSLELYKGENLVVLGKSGSGKSVLIKCNSGCCIK